MAIGALSVTATNFGTLSVFMLIKAKLAKLAMSKLVPLAYF